MASNGTFDDNNTSMGGLVLDCFICHRLMIYPSHRKDCLNDWNRHGRICLKCIIRHKYPDLGLGGYILEAQIHAKLFNTI